MEKPKASKWARLRQLIRNKKIDIKNKEEHIFNSPYVTEQNGSTKDETYSFEEGLSVKVNLPETDLNLESVAKNRNDGIDSTGHLMWPAESFLAKFALSLPMGVLRGSKVLELGAGYSGLLGIALAKKYKNSNLEENDENGQKIEIVVTDGNAHCEPKIEDNFKLNGLMNDDIIKTATFNWKNHSDFLEKWGKFDYIFGADILFFRDYHNDLVDALDSLMSPDGLVYLMAPDRDNTLTQFCEKAQSRFLIEREALKSIELFKDIFGNIESKPGYDKGKHDIQLLKLTRIKNND